MKALKEYLISENRLSAEGFNKWLEKRYGYSDLYEYFSDLIEPDWKGKDNSTLSKYAKELLEKVPESIIDDANDAGLDPQEVAWEVVNDIVRFR